MSEQLDKQFMDASDGLAGLPVSASSYELDPSRYMAHVEEFDISEEQKIELLQTLWSVMRSFVEMGFKGDVCVQIFGESLKDLEEDSAHDRIDAAIPAQNGERT